MRGVRAVEPDAEGFAEGFDEGFDEDALACGALVPAEFAAAPSGGGCDAHAVSPRTAAQSSAAAEANATGRRITSA